MQAKLRLSDDRPVQKIGLTIKNVYTNKHVPWWREVGGLWSPSEVWTLWHSSYSRTVHIPRWSEQIVYSVGEKSRPKVTMVQVSEWNFGTPFFQMPKNSWNKPIPRFPVEPLNQYLTGLQLITGRSINISPRVNIQDFFQVFQGSGIGKIVPRAFLITGHAHVHWRQVGANLSLQRQMTSNVLSSMQYIYKNAGNKISVSWR